MNQDQIKTKINQLQLQEAILDGYLNDKENKFPNLMLDFGLVTIQHFKQSGNNLEPVVLTALYSVHEMEPAMQIQFFAFIRQMIISERNRLNAIKETIT